MNRLDEQALAHAARAPQKRVVGGQAACEAARVLEQRFARGVDALEQRQRQARHMRHLDKSAVQGLQTKASPLAGACRPMAAGASRSRASAMRFKSPFSLGAMGQTPRLQS